MFRKVIGPLTWAYAIIIGGALILTPDGIVPIVTNPPIRIVIAVVGLALGILGFISQPKRSV